MKMEQIERILTSAPGLRREGAAFVLAEDCDVSFHLALADELVTVARVSRVERMEDLLVLDTHAGDRYFCWIDAVSMIKMAQQSKRARIPAAGFR